MKIRKLARIMALSTALILCAVCLSDARGETGAKGSQEKGDFIFLNGLTYETPVDALDEILGRKGEVSTDPDSFMQEKKYLMNKNN